MIGIGESKMTKFKCKKCGYWFGWVLEGLFGCCAYCTGYPDGTKARVKWKISMSSGYK